MKKILLLGGSMQQIPAIEYANNQGYYTVLCDYLSDNPGQAYAKKFYNISTTDKESVLAIAKAEAIDGVVAYASDPAALTAAYVADQLGLPTNPLQSIEILAYKDKFRDFLAKHGFNCPYAKRFSDLKSAIQEVKEFRFPVMVKPIDSSGSKGVSKVETIDDFEKAYKIACDNSKKQQVIVEEFIFQDHPYMIAGDCFVIHGKVEFWGFLNSHRNITNHPYVPIGTSYPVYISERRLALAKEACEKLIDLLNIEFGAYNIEILIDQNEKLYFIELGPRNGGNMIPELLQMATGNNTIAATIETAMGHEYGLEKGLLEDKYLTTYVLHSTQNGYLKEIKYKNGMDTKIFEKVLYKNIGDYIEDFDGSNKAIGIVFLKFDSQEEQLSFMDNPDKDIEVIVESKQQIQVTRSSMPEFDEYIDEIKTLWDSHWLTNMGIKHKMLESQLLDFLSVPNISLFTNGHMALESIIAAFELKGEVITTPFTFASTTHAIVRNGLKPVFCDINSKDYTIDVEKIEGLITERTSAIIPVHVYGQICDVDRIKEIANRYKLKVIYDAAHAFGVKVKGQGVGCFGDASVFSFHATKVFNTIEGGAVTYSNPALEEVLNNMKNFGITEPESVASVGGNAKMNEFQAAMGICNLRHINREIGKRKIIIERYVAHLKNLDGIRLLQPQKGVDNNYAYLPVLFEGYKMSRDQVYEKLKEHSIFARKYFYPLTNSFECYRGLYDVDETPVAKGIADCVLTLPLYADLDIYDVDRICEIIKRG